MAARREQLQVRYAGVHVADLRARRPWQLELRYTDEALERWPRNTPLVSCSLPLGRQRLDASVFCRGLLPEGDHLRALAERIGRPSNDAHALLAAFGRDVAGALTITEGEPGPRLAEVVAYTDDDLEEEVAGLPDRPLAIHDDSELSLAGLQDKMTLVALPDGRWGRPVRGAPSTHVLKLEDGRHPGLVDAEAACLRLAQALDLTAVDAQVRSIAGRRCLIVERFDRRRGPDGDVVRLHQEDACQALARDPAARMGRGKYEDAGGPSLAEVARLLDVHAADAPTELDALVAATTFTVLTGNADAHGKNVALLHPEPGRVELAPLYDTVPTALWSTLRTIGAMRIGGVRELGRVRLEDIVAEAARWPHEPARARAVALATAGRALDALDVVGDLPELRARIEATAHALGRS